VLNVIKLGELATIVCRNELLELLETVVAEIPRTVATGMGLIGVLIWRERDRNKSYRQTTALTKTRRGWKKYIGSYC